MTAPNITQDKETGIGNWSDADIKKLLRTGDLPNGVHDRHGHADRLLRHHDRRDLDAVVAYLRTLKPISNKVADPIYKMPQVEHVLPGGEKPYTEAMMSDKVKKGFYLATIAHCMECHTPMVQGHASVGHASGRRRFRLPGPLGRLDLAQHHLEQDQGHRRVDRRRDQAGDHHRRHARTAAISSRRWASITTPR